MGIVDVASRGRVVFRELSYFPYLLFPLNLRVPWSELDYENYESTWEAVGAATEAVIPFYRAFAGVPHIPVVMPPGESPFRGQSEAEELWFFLNGICTNEDVLRLNGEALASIFGRRISLLHNPSDGVVLDLLECAAGRTAELFEPVSRSVADILEMALASGRKVVLIAHSQGGIISAKAINHLHSKLQGADRALLGQLELYTFASAATHLQAPEIYAEHFYNTRDYVARIGVAGYEDEISGRFFTAEATGHLLNAHYLNNFVADQYRPRDEGGPSRLLSYRMASAEPEPSD